MGSAVNESDLTRELESLARAGFGGVEITPIYGAKGRENESVEFLSPRWMQLLHHAVNEARRLGMAADMTTGTGWCFGGPNVDDGDANALAEWRDGNLHVGPSGVMVKRAAPGGEGPMLNLLRPGAVRRYLRRFDAAFGANGTPELHAVFHDSYEYRSNWSPELPEKFLQHHGYELDPAVLFGRDGSPRALRMRHDYRVTVDELLLESMNDWTDWAHAHGFQTRYQAHGSPGNWLDLYAAADIPETEVFARDRDVLVSKFASSAAHVSGKNIASAETGTWASENFQETLAELKGIADEMFLAGVNRIVFHGTAYSPQDVPWPGWVFYASTQMNPRNPVWRDVPALTAYIGRCQAALQAGEPDNAVLLYWPLHDRWSKGDGLPEQFTVHNAGNWLRGEPVGGVADRLWRSGVSFDYVSDRQLRRAVADDGKIRIGKRSWSAVVIPPRTRMPETTAQKIAELGAASPMLVVRDVRDAETFREPVAECGLQFIRRKVADGWIYFLVADEKGMEAWVPLAVPAGSVVLTAPTNGRSGSAAVRHQGGAAEVFLQLAPRESVLVHARAEEAVSAEPWQYWKAAGNPASLSCDWKLEFLEGGPTLPAPAELPRTVAWSSLPREDARNFSGTARYTATFDSPDPVREFWRLDLGAVGQSARVRLNEADLGTLIAAPFALDGIRLLPAGNVLEIEVTSTAANRIRDLDRRGVKWNEFHDIGVVSMDYRPFDASGWDTAESGLAGPVTLTPHEPKPA
jgi:hypothetical protein